MALGGAGRTVPGPHGSPLISLNSKARRHGQLFIGSMGMGTKWGGQWPYQCESTPPLHRLDRKNMLTSAKVDPRTLTRRLPVVRTPPLRQ